MNHLQNMDKLAAESQGRLFMPLSYARASNKVSLRVHHGALLLLFQPGKAQKGEKVEEPSYISPIHITYISSYVPYISYIRIYIYVYISIYAGTSKAWLPSTHLQGSTEVLAGQHAFAASHRCSSAPCMSPDAYIISSPCLSLLVWKSCLEGIPDSFLQS